MRVQLAKADMALSRQHREYEKQVQCTIGVCVRVYHACLCAYACVPIHMCAMCTHTHLCALHTFWDPLECEGLSVAERLLYSSDIRRSHLYMHIYSCAHIFVNSKYIEATYECVFICVYAQCLFICIRSCLCRQLKIQRSDMERLKKRIASLKKIQ
jgi:hypothetical protein